MPAQIFLKDYLYPHYGLYIISLIICFLFSYIVFHKKIRSIIDPLLIFVVTWSLANSVAVFLCLCGEVETELILYFVLTTIIIAATYYYAYPDKKDKILNCTKLGVTQSDKIIFIFVYSIFLLSTFYKYILNGIPIFNESRFEINIDNSSGILGALGRVSDACNGFIFIFAFYQFFNGTKRFAVFVLLSMIIINFLNGSKGFILVFVSWLFFYNIFFEGKTVKLKKQYLAIVLLTPVVVILTAGMAKGLDSLSYFAYRVLAYGDIYWNAYPNNTLNQIDYTSPIENMTFMLWGPFRHILEFDISGEAMTTGGALIFEKVNGFYPDAGAPNSPINIMSWVYYRWNGLFLVTITFTIEAWIFKRIGTMKRNLIGVFIQGNVLQMCFSNDVYLFFNKFFQLFLFLTIFLLLSITINLIRKK